MMKLDVCVQEILLGHSAAMLVVRAVSETNMYLCTSQLAHI